VLKEVFARVAALVAEVVTRGGFWGRWRLMAIDGLDWDAPETPENAAAVRVCGLGLITDPPKVRVVNISECVSPAMVDAEIGGVAGAGSADTSTGPPLVSAPGR
jgi:hypothetical protein